MLINMRPLPSHAEAVIIGGGIIGVSIAYYLVKKGMRHVVLLERGMMGERASGKCAGGIRTQCSGLLPAPFTWYRFWSMRESSQFYPCHKKPLLVETLNA
jgi:glycine/D-amino acid oxidase-like deaminating enzyme